MSSVSHMIGRLARDEKDRAIREGRAHTVAALRKSLARRCGVAPGTIENIQRNRLKFVEHVEASVRAAFIHLLEKELVQTTTELSRARCASQAMGPDALEAVAAAMDSVEVAKAAALRVLAENKP